MPNRKSLIETAFLEYHKKIVRLINELDRLDEKNFFGPEGWRYHVGMEDFKSPHEEFTLALGKALRDAS